MGEARSSEKPPPTLFVLVELDVKYLPIPYADTGMTTLMALIAIVTAKVLHSTSIVDGDFINGKKS